MHRCRLSSPAAILTWTLPEVINGLEAVEDDGKPPPPPGGVPNHIWRTLSPVEKLRVAREWRRGY